MPGVSGSGFLYASEKGITGCAVVSAGPAQVGGGFGYPWGGGLGDIRLWFDSCGALDFNSAGDFSGLQGAREAAVRPLTLRVPKGQHQTLIGAMGVSAEPDFTLRSPRGTTITARLGAQGPLDGGGYRVVSDPLRHGVYVVIARPAAGVWTLQLAPGSPAIRRFGSALSAPPARVSAKVTRVRGREVLRFAATPVPGQRLRFLEIGRYVIRDLLDTSRSRGALRFTPTDTGNGEIRHIEILVSQNGLPRTQLAGPRFRVPRPARPPRIRRLTGRLNGTTARLAGTPPRGPSTTTSSSTPATAAGCSSASRRGSARCRSTQLPGPPA